MAFSDQDTREYVHRFNFYQRMNQRPAPAPVINGTSIVGFASWETDNPSITTDTEGNPQEIAAVGLNTAYEIHLPEGTAEIPSPLPFDESQGATIVVPRDGIITSFYAHWEMAYTPNWNPGAEGTVHAQLVRATQTSKEFNLVPGTVIDMEPVLTIDKVYDPDDGHALFPNAWGGMTLNVPVAVGDKLLVLFYITGENMGGSTIYPPSKLSAGVAIG